MIDQMKSPIPSHALRKIAISIIETAKTSPASTRLISTATIDRIVFEWARAEFAATSPEVRRLVRRYALRMRDDPVFLKLMRYS